MWRTPPASPGTVFTAKATGTAGSSPWWTPAASRRLLLADEPTGNLDSENSDNIIDLLLKLAHDENRCVIVVTHDLSVMDRADVVYRINDGLLERR